LSTHIAKQNSAALSSKSKEEAAPDIFYDARKCMNCCNEEALKRLTKLQFTLGSRSSGGLRRACYNVALPVTVDKPNDCWTRQIRSPAMEPAIEADDSARE